MSIGPILADFLRNMPPMTMDELRQSNAMRQAEIWDLQDALREIIAMTENSPVDFDDLPRLIRERACQALKE